MNRQSTTYPNMTLLAIDLQRKADFGNPDDTGMTTPVKSQTWVEKGEGGLAVCIETGGAVYKLFTCNAINLSVDVLPAMEEKAILPGGKWCLQANKCHVVRIVGLLTDQGYTPTLPQMVVYTNPSGNNRSRTVEEFRRLFVPYVPPVEVEEDSGGIVKKPTLKSSAKAFKPGRVWRFIHNASDLVTIVCVSTVTIGGRTIPPTVIFTDNAGEEKYMSLYEFQLLYNPVPK